MMRSGKKGRGGLRHTSDTHSWVSRHQQVAGQMSLGEQRGACGRRATLAQNQVVGGVGFRRYIGAR